MSSEEVRALEEVKQRVAELKGKGEDVTELLVELKRLKGVCGEEVGKKKKEKKTKLIDLNPPSGTRDFFPEDMRAQEWLFDKFSSTSVAFGFEKYDAPVLENEILYKRKGGEEIVDQMYNFVDKEGAQVTLRPEMTPTLARMVLNLMREATGDVAGLLPLKW